MLQLGTDLMKVQVCTVLLVAILSSYKNVNRKDKLVIFSSMMCFVLYT